MWLLTSVCFHHTAEVAAGLRVHPRQPGLSDGHPRLRRDRAKAGPLADRRRSHDDRRSGRHAGENHETVTVTLDT